MKVSVLLQDIKVNIEIANPSTETVQVVEDAVQQGGYSLVIPPINFTITAVYGDSTVEVTRFSAYVERKVVVPEGVDPDKITTGVVIEPDGTVRHVPTKIIEIDGVYYAQINSLTNSTYSVIWNPIQFVDVENHWSKDSVNDMGSRLIVSGTGDGLYRPDRAITRAEFASIIVRALGLKTEKNEPIFTDVKPSDWYSAAVIRLMSSV